MKINDICESTTSGSVATVAQPMTGGPQRRSNIETGIYPAKQGENLLIGKKTSKKYANSVREAFDLKFHVVQLAKEQLNEYSVKLFDHYNINKHNQRFKHLLLQMHKNHPMLESTESDEIEHFVQTIVSLNSKKTVKVGDMFSVLSFIINPVWKEIEVIGFTSPKEVKEIKSHSDGSINYIRFADNDRYPRVPVAAVGKHPTQHPAYFINEKAAEQALLRLKLILPETWDMDISSVNDSNYRSGLDEDNMKINDIYESKRIKETHLDEEELIIVPGQGHNKKSGFIPHKEDRRDHEVSMARSDLFQAAKNAKQTFEMLEGVSEDEGIEGWVQAKITKAADYLATVREYLEGKQVQGMAEGAKVDRMVKHVEKSEEKAGKSKKEAENIAWATANKRGMLNNKNHVKGK